jgi:hypothetical protein
MIMSVAVKSTRFWNQKDMNHRLSTLPLW